MSVTREQIADMLVNNDFVAITYSKVNGEVTTRIATIRKRPEADAPQGKRDTNEANFRYYEWGAANRFDPAAPGDWKSCKIANIIKIEPVKV